jgi:acyl phosphate:glycerol-3-phosphate acyltransferase
VLRTGGKGIAAATLALDLLKGAGAVLIGWEWGETAVLAAAVAAVIGHMFPVWLGFRGGKGLATAFGVVIVIAWPVALGGFLLWLAVALIFHYSSLAALVATVTAAVAAGFVVDPERAIVIALIAVLVILRHHENIRRLLAGTESRISLRKS